jgi:iron-sulfur cluster repair protein YtfE (RIC family)
VVDSINKGLSEYTKYVESVHGTANKEVFKVYDQVTKDLVAAMMKEMMSTLDKDLDKYCEKVIYEEF